MAVVAEICTPQEILSFWFGELGSDDWFNGTPRLDEQCHRRFCSTHLALAREIAPEWRSTAENRLAAVIVLDQLPRNMFRATPLAFATDQLALREAKLALDAGADTAMTGDRRAFFYMPFEHAEDLAEQTLSVKLFTDLGDADYLDFAIRHREIVRAFGRFPHRNAIIGRPSSPAEEAFLLQPGSGF